MEMEGQAIRESAFESQLYPLATKLSVAELVRKYSMKDSKETLGIEYCPDVCIYGT